MGKNKESTFLTKLNKLLGADPTKCCFVLLNDTHEGFLTLGVVNSTLSGPEIFFDAALIVDKNSIEYSLRVINRYGDLVFNMHILVEYTNTILLPKDIYRSAELFKYYCALSGRYLDSTADADFQPMKDDSLACIETFGLEDPSVTFTASQHSREIKVSASIPRAKQKLVFRFGSEVGGFALLQVYPDTADLQIDKEALYNFTIFNSRGRANETIFSKEHIVSATANSCFTLLYQMYLIDYQADVLLEAKKTIPSD